MNEKKVMIKKKVKNYSNPLHKIENLVIDPIKDEKIVPDFLKKSWDFKYGKHNSN